MVRFCWRRNPLWECGTLVFVFLTSVCAQFPPVNGPCPLEVPEGGAESFAAWSAIFNAQPHHVASPYKEQLLPPSILPGICVSSMWNSSGWKSSGVIGTDWIAHPSGDSDLIFSIGGADCSQILASLGVLTAIEGHASLRLIFSGCGRPASVLALRLTNDTKPSTGTGEPTVTGLGLLAWMCAVDFEGCKNARAKLASFDTSVAAGMRVAKGKVGVGRCTGYGVQPHPVTNPEPTTASECAALCQQRIARNLADPAQGSCRGYAWSEHLHSCIVYDGWPVTETDNSWSTDGYFCDNMTAMTSEVPGRSSLLPDPVQVRLDFANIFADPRAITARRMQVSPFIAGCFAAFDWYLLDRWINIPVQDLAVLTQMTKPKGDFIFNRPSDGGHAPRSNLLVERVCIRDCEGVLRAECEAQEGIGPAPLGVETTLGSSFIERLPTEDAELIPWMLLCAAGAALAGFSSTSCVRCVTRSCHFSSPDSQSVEEVKLVFEGDEEETLALRSTPEGGFVSGNRGVEATWAPSKGSGMASSAGVFSSFFTSKAPLATR